LGLLVFGLLEHVLWPVRAADRMRARLADVLSSLAGLARACVSPGGLHSGEVDARRRLISEQVADVQGFIEASKFEPGAAGVVAIQRLIGDAQTVFLVLLAIARQQGALPPTAHETTRRLPMDAAAAVEAVAEHLRRGGPRPAFDLDGTLTTVERDIAAHGPLEDEAVHGRLLLYRELVVAVNRLAPDDLKTSRT
jgi:plasmid stabilization system protein ParE